MAAALVSLVAVGASVAGADSFTPVRLKLKSAQVARLHRPFTVTVQVSADPGALDTRNGPIRAQVKLAPECSGTFAQTDGPVLLDRRVSPQPSTGRAYSGAARGAGKPAAYGQQLLCTWLVDEGDGRVFAFDQSTAVDVSPGCTTAAARYDAAHRRHRSRRSLTRLRRAARRACGPGVRL